MRPNIRVEIQNNLVESMEVDENEEGEISDSEEKAAPEKPLQFINPPPSESAFDILDKEKLQKRAHRFRLNPNEVKNFTDEDLQVLQSSLGINATNEANVRFEVIHMRGIEQLSAADILDYFMEYAPVSLEWIDEESCNVVWSDKISAARALHFISKAVRGMPVRDDSSYFDQIQETEEVDQSVLLMNKNREIQLQDDTETPVNKLLNEENSVDITEITTTIPPGYWRLGNKSSKGRCLLLRFSLKTDKKHFKVEPFSRYYKSQGKKTWSAPQKQTQGIFGRNKEMHRNPSNPWTVLAKNWDEDAKFREKERIAKEEEAKIEIKNPGLRVRLGSKRKEDELNEEEEVEEEAEKPKKVKIPRMRMYADEEEEKIRRKKMLKRIDQQIKRIDEDKTTSSDLRSVLNMGSRTHAAKLEPPEPEVFDLGSTLKNRRKMVFEIKTEDKVEKPMESYQSKSSRERTRRERRRSSDEDDTNYFRSDSYRRDKPQSKVAVVIKTQKKPSVASAVASTVFSRISKPHDSESESASESSTESSSESDSEGGTLVEGPRHRPGFTTHTKTDIKSPLKIEINNDHFKRS